MNYTKRIIADEFAVDIRFDVFVCEYYPQLSRGKIQKAIDNELVILNNKPAKKRVKLAEGDIVLVDEDELLKKTDTVIVPQDIPIDIIWEDEHYAAINKPAGLVVHPGNGNPDKTLVNALAFHLKALSVGAGTSRPGIVHRLDKETSGVIIVAKTDEAHMKMAELFAQREIHKEYVGICVGAIREDRGEMNGSVGRKRNDPIKYCVTPTGRHALTEYNVVSTVNGISIIHFRLHTGRTHQIRVHCSHAHMPIIADPFYGGDKKAILTLQPMNRIFAHKVYKCFNRQALHARRVTLIHPFTNKELTIEAPLPKDFSDAVKLFEEETEKTIKL